MVLTYERKYIEPGKPAQAGHVVYPNATYKDSSNEKPINIIFKLNKNSNKQLSLNEVAFNRLAQQFLRPNLTSAQYLVYNRNTLIGVASPNLRYEVYHKEKGNTFYEINQSTKKITRTANHDNAPSIPFYFFDELSNNFFSELCRLRDEEALTFDVNSLASVLCTSYVLEEDDLHKGNFGFYIVKRNNLPKPEVVFCRIDHDMLLSNSVTSFHHSRVFNWVLEESDFDITPEDIISFPNIKSANYYWPTQYRFFVKPFDKRIYSASDRQTYAQLSKDEEFKKAKWREFLKFILVPPVLIEHALAASYDPEKAEDKAQITMLTNTIVARQAQLRAVLFSLLEFRNFLKSLPETIQSELTEEILGEYKDDKSLREAIRANLTQYQAFSDQVKENDTPLHVAIRLGDYRYDETLKAFGKYINCKNKNGETPLKVNPPEKIDRGDIRGNKMFIRNHLQQKPLKLKDFNENNPISLPQISTNLIQAINNIGSDYSLSLKMKKMLTYRYIRQVIEASPANLKDLLTDFKTALNKTHPPELQFIRQLRSSLWIVRQIRGLFGLTSTQQDLNHLIDKTLKSLEPQQRSCWSPF